MNVVIQHCERAETARLWRGGDPCCGQQIGGSVSTRRVRPAHGASDHDRFLATHQQVEDESGFLDRVRTLDDDGAVEA